ncbi:SgcJ/EcaC family oxidoreductase [Amycolatopsis samaneae]|uniref:SgcJ/EcaC family oxidoreductase n=1 Tax=Amycolatopsis samaneae TaxID=664691 RepID=A0ABW5GUX1_9PSEU
MTVEEIITGLERAWNAGDGAAWGARFAEDADFVDVVGRIQRGRKVIAEEHQKIFDTIYRGSLLEIRRLDVRPIGEGALLVHTTSKLRVPGGPRKGEWAAIQTKVVRDGEIMAFHNTGLTGLAEFAHRDADLAAREPLEWKG